MKAGTGVGIAGLVIAIVGAFLPIIGLYVGWIALLIVCIAALLGGRGLTIATVVVSVVAFIFLTPSLWIAEGMRAIAVETGAPAEVTQRIGLPISVVMVIAPIVCIFLNVSGKVALGKTRD